MASLLGGGAECGPSNPLNNLVKNVDNDRTLQRDRIQAHPEASQNVFRQGPPPPDAAEAERFFHQQGPPHTSGAFDLAPLGRALTPQQHPHHHAPSPGPSWASDYNVQAGPPGGPAAAHMYRHPEASSSSHSGPQVAESSNSSWAREMNNAAAQACPSTSHLSTQAPPAAVVGPAGPGPMQFHHQPMVPHHPTPMQFHHQPPPPAAQVHQSPMVHQQQHDKQAFDAAFGQATEASTWDEAFKNQESQIKETQHESLTARPTSPHGHQDSDALARTAGELLDNVSSSSNPKFKKSSFMNFMKKLRDHEVTVEGDKVVESTAEGLTSQIPNGPTTATSTATATAGPSGSASYSQNTSVEEFHMHSYRDYANKMDADAGYDEVNAMWDQEYATRQANQREEREQDTSAQAKKVQFQGDGGALQEQDQEQEQEQGFDNEGIVNGPFLGNGTNNYVSPQQEEWHHLQREWEAWEATSTGVQPTTANASSSSSKLQTQLPTESPSGYVFTQNNPYLYNVEGAQVLSPYADPEFVSGHRDISQVSPNSSYASVLQKEAFAQVNSGDPLAWYSLGIKQQENEREDKAISALLQATEIQPDYHEAWLALAISYSNESAKASTFDAIESWMKARKDLFDQQTLTSIETHLNSELYDRHSHLVNHLIKAANTVGHVDADIQIALGTLFSSIDDYAKAGDCFSSALSVRPEDHLLFNRVGASLANQGYSDQAAAYYHKALEIQPDYARARYNIAISYINTKKAKLAAEHLIKALELQQADADNFPGLVRSDGSPDMKEQGGVTSDVLWDALRVACGQIAFSPTSEGSANIVDAAQSKDIHVVAREFAKIPRDE